MGQWETGSPDRDKPGQVLACRAPRAPGTARGPCGQRVKEIKRQGVGQC